MAGSRIASIVFTPDPAALRLTFSVDASAGTFLLEVSQPSQRPLVFGGSSHRLQEIRNGLSGRLEDVKLSVMTNVDSEGSVRFGDQLDLALRHLHEESLSVLSALTGDANMPKIRHLNDVLRSALWRRSTPPLVQVIAPRDYWIPIELLTYNAAAQPTVHDLGSLKRVCESFVGFSARVQRLLLDDDTDDSQTLSQERTLTADGGLPVTVFHDASLRGARREYDALSDLGERIDLQGPWPDKELDREEALRVLVQHLVDPRRGLRGGHRRLADQVQHFICHCTADDGGSRSSIIYLSAADADPVAISIEAMRQRRVAAAVEWTEEELPPAEVKLPLIFLNACGSAIVTDRVEYRGASSFPDFFLSIGSRGFIGTETDIPDSFAAEFAGRFYSHLVDGVPTGLSLIRAKWDMVHLRQNPLGILYTMYADPDLRVVVKER